MNSAVPILMSVLEPSSMILTSSDYAFPIKHLRRGSARKKRFHGIWDELPAYRMMIVPRCNTSPALAGTKLTEDGR